MQPINERRRFSNLPPHPLPLLLLSTFRLAEGFELYDLNADPHEVDNIFDRAPRSLIAALQSQLSLLKVGLIEWLWHTAVGRAASARRQQR